MRGAWEDGGSRRAARIGAAIAVGVFVLLSTRGRPWELFVRGPFTSDFYDVQARAISRGRLDIDPQVASIEGFVVDGRTHLYYGIVPALARVPLAAFTRAFDGRLVLLSMAVGVGVGCLASARLLQRAGAALGVELPTRCWPWITASFAAAVGLASPLLWLSSRGLVYHEAELWGATLAIVGFERIVAWWTSERRRDLVGASLVAALALSTRGSSGVGPAIALGMSALVLARRRAWRDAGAVMVAVAVPVAVYALVNWLRFGSMLSVPFDRQVVNDFSAPRRAALADNGESLFGIKFLPTAIVQYLRPDAVSPRALAPWLSWNGRATVLGDVTFDIVDRSASLPTTAPGFLAAAAVGAAAAIRRRLPVCWGLSMLGATVAVLPTLTIAFIAQRYLADFVPGLVVGASIGVPILAAWAAHSTARRRALAGAAVVLASAAFTVNAGLAVVARHLHLFPTTSERRDFVAAQFAIHRRLGGSTPPGLVRVDDLGLPGPEGQVAILGDCDGLFRSDGASWATLELRGGGAQRAVVRGGPLGPVVLGDRWRIVLDQTSDGRVLRYVGPPRVEGIPIAGTGEIEVDVRADPSIPAVVVDVDGVRSLEAFWHRAAGPVVPAAGWVSVSLEAPLCRELQQRLG